MKRLLVFIFSSLILFLSGYFENKEHLIYHLADSYVTTCLNNEEQILRAAGEPDARYFISVLE
jgi:hypothetical protein